MNAPAKNLPAIGQRVEMVSISSNWNVGEKGRVTEVHADRFAVLFDGREDDYTAFSSDIKGGCAVNAPAGQPVAHTAAKFAVELAQNLVLNIPEASTAANLFEKHTAALLAERDVLRAALNNLVVGSDELVKQLAAQRGAPSNGFLSRLDGARAALGVVAK